MSRYLTTADLIHINVRMAQRWGGTSGVRDLGLLESAVARPQNGYYADVLEQAAALCESLLQNHPFLDGNKRSAVVATAVFLRWDGYKLQFSDRDMYDWLMALYDQKCVNRQELDRWLRTHAVETSLHCAI
jgi:death-on-curing protein